MKYLMLSSIVFVLLSCGSEGSEKGKDKDSTKTDSSNASGMTSLEYCKELKPFQFCSAGLDFIRLGDTLVDLSYPPVHPPIQVPGSIRKDTVFTQKVIGGNSKDDVTWNVTMLKFDDGKLILESDIQTGVLLKRIRIETPRYVGPGRIHVGMTVGELKKVFPQLICLAYPEFNIVELKQDATFFFQVKNDGYFDPKDTSDPVIDLAKIPDSAKVSAIVVLTQNLI